MKKEFKSYEAAVEFALTLDPGLIHLVILHDDTCPGVWCRCSPDYVLEYGISIDRGVELAQMGAKYLKSKMS